MTDRAVEIAVCRIIFQQVGVRLCICEIINRNNLDVARMPIKHRPEGKPPYSSKSIYADTNCHAISLLLWRCVRLVVWAL